MRDQDAFVFLEGSLRSIPQVWNWLILLSMFDIVVP